MLSFDYRLEVAHADLDVFGHVFPLHQVALVLPLKTPFDQNRRDLCAPPWIIDNAFSRLLRAQKLREKVKEDQNP
jgi:hypothetical protein